MVRRKELKQQAAQLRGDIDHRVYFVHEQIDRLIHQASSMALSPAALPVAFVSGILAERWGMFAIKNAHTLLSSLSGQRKPEDMISGFIRSSLR